jgi:hypothetical protein
VVYRLHRREFLTLAFSRTLCSTCKQPVKAQKRVRANLKVLLRKSSGFSFQAGLQARTASSTFYNPCTSYKPLMRLTTFFAFTRKHFRAPISRQLLVITSNCFCKLPAWGTLPRYEVTVTYRASAYFGVSAVLIISWLITGKVVIGFSVLPACNTRYDSQLYHLWPQAQ